MTLAKLSYTYILPGKGEISRPSFDEEELLSDAVQRVWWYLHLFETNPEVIQSFRFNPQRKLMDPAECLETLIRFATLFVRDASFVLEKGGHSNTWSLRRGNSSERCFQRSSLKVQCLRKRSTTICNYTLKVFAVLSLEYS